MTIEKISLQEYYQSLLRMNLPVIKGDGDYLWVKHERFSVIRFPEFNTSKPSKKEILSVFKNLRCLIINYTFIPSEKDYSNSHLYNSVKQNYDFQKLSKNVRRDIKSGQEKLKYGFADWNEILSDGLIAFTDTRTRVGLSDGNKRNFNKRFHQFSTNPSHKAAAAWFEGKIIAFMSLIVVEDYVIIQGSFSTNEHKKLCANNVLVDFILNYFLIENHYHIVCYGLSSIQENNQREGLHNYKIRVGFEAIPVKRVFLPHPNLKVFHSFIRKALYILSFIFSKNRFIRKATGLFNFIE